MKTRADTYQPYILDNDVGRYCATQIEPFQVEIEHVGMKALIDVLISPARIAVEILYLDRSAGMEVNSHRFEALTTGDNSGLYGPTPTIYLLYRPYVLFLIFYSLSSSLLFLPPSLSLFLLFSSFFLLLSPLSPPRCWLGPSN